MSTNMNGIILTKSDGSELDRNPIPPRGVKARIAEYFRKAGQPLKSADPNNLGIMDEMAKLTDSDLADFRRWFNDAGYPVAEA